MTRADPAEGPGAALERGTVYGDIKLHAIKPSLYASRAFCGAGLIAARIPGRFEPGSEGSCPGCIAELAIEPTQTPE